MARIARPILFASILFLFAGHCIAQPMDSRTAAVSAFCRAYDIVGEAPLDEACLGTVVTLANYLSVENPDKARLLLERGYRRATLPPERGGMHGLGGHEGECVSLLGDVSCRDASACLQFAEIAARFDERLARRYLRKASESLQSDSDSARLLGMTAVTALRLLNGEGQAPVDAAAAYCKAHPELVHGDKKMRTRKRVLAAFVAFDPDAAIRFAAEFDSDFYGRAMMDAACTVSLTNPRRGLYYHRMALENADVVANSYLGRRMRERAAWAFAREGLPALLAALGEVAAAEFEKDEPPVESMYRSDFGKLLAAERRGLPQVVSFIATWRDICKAEVARNPDVLDEVSAYPSAPSRTALLLEAVNTLAERGETRRALRLARGMPPNSARAKALAAVAQSMHGRHPDKAASLFEEAVDLAMKSDGTDNTTAYVAGRLYEVDKAAGMTCFKKAVARALSDAVDGDPAGGPRRCALLLKRLGWLDPGALCRAVDNVPALGNPPWGSEAQAAYAEALPLLAASDPDAVYDMLKSVHASRHFIADTAYDVAHELAHSRPEDAERFLDFVADEKQRKDLVERIAHGRLSKAIREATVTPADLMRQFPPSEYPRDLYYRHPVHLALKPVVRHDRELALAFARALPDPEIRDICLYYLAFEIPADIETVTPFVEPIGNPETAAAAWKHTGLGHARKVQEWEVLNGIP